MFTEQSQETDVIKKALSILHSKNISSNAKILYMVLCSGSEKAPDSDTTYLNAYTQDQLIELSNISSKSTITRALRELEDNKLIGIMKKHVCNVYLIY